MATKEQQARWYAKNRRKWNIYQREYARIKRNRISAFEKGLVGDHKYINPNHPVLK